MTRSASDWFVIMQDESVPAPERAQFSEWLAQSPEHVAAYLEVAGTWRKLGNTAAAQMSVAELVRQAREEHSACNVIQMAQTRSPDTDPGCPTGDGERSAAFTTTRRPGKRRLLRLAAAASVAIAVLSTWFAIEHHRGVRYATAVGEQVSFTLQDGSTVRLNTQSTIRVKLSKRERVIALLQGEAMFEVTRDATRPFRVKAGGTVVEALGTVFNVNRTKSDTTVTVVEGRVRVSTPIVERSRETLDGGNVQAAEITARDRVRVTRAGEIVTEHDVSVDRVLAWTDRRLIFHGETLAAVAEEFNRYNRMHVEITDPDLASLRINGNFHATDLQSLVDYLENVEGVRVEKRGDLVSLSQH